jgi:hypothetical protein
MGLWIVLIRLRVINKELDQIDPLWVDILTGGETGAVC